jgi:hypothetical protein
MAQALDNNTQIVRTPNWSSENVRRACIRNDLYTVGDSGSYLRMLSDVDKNPTPSDFGLFIIARDIADHSENQTVSNVMYILANEAVWYTFTLNGRDDI